MAVTCTSGTAAAELLPGGDRGARGARAADRAHRRPPAELRDDGAGQAIDQLKLFGDAAKWFVEVGSHDATPERLRWIRTLACRAYWTALEGRPGPVHLNFPLREPLVHRGAAARRGDGRPTRRRGRRRALRARAPLPARSRGVDAQALGS